MALWYYDRVGELPRRLFGAEQLGIVAQASLVALQCRDVIGALVGDLLGDLALTPHGVDRHGRPLDHQQVQ